MKKTVIEYSLFSKIIAGILMCISVAFATYWAYIIIAYPPSKIFPDATLELIVFLISLYSIKYFEGFLIYRIEFSKGKIEFQKTFSKVTIRQGEAKKAYILANSVLPYYKNYFTPNCFFKCKLKNGKNFMYPLHTGYYFISLFFPTEPFYQSIKLKIKKIRVRFFERSSQVDKIIFDGSNYFFKFSWILL